MFHVKHILDEKRHACSRTPISFPPKPVRASRGRKHEEQPNGDGALHLLRCRVYTRAGAKRNRLRYIPDRSLKEKGGWHRQDAQRPKCNV